MNDLATAFWRRPELFPFQVDFSSRRVLLIELNQSVQRNAAFLDRRALDRTSSGVWVEWSELQTAGENLDLQQVTRFVFHIGHCGSTLVSRVLGSLPAVRCLREPLLFLALAEAHWNRKQAQAPWLSAEEQEGFFRFVVQSLGRAQEGEPRVVIKPSSHCNMLLPALWDTVPAARVVALRTSLTIHLLQMLKNADRRRENRQRADLRRQQLAQRHDLDLAPLDRCSDGEIAAMNWVTDTDLLRWGRNDERLLEMDFDLFLANPAKELRDAAVHLRLPAASAQVDAALAAGHLGKNAKLPDQSFGAEQRRDGLRQCAKACAGELSRGLVWADSIFQNVPALEHLRGLVGEVPPATC